MLLNNVSYYNDEDRRKIYVGLTRAKKELYVHYNNGCFDGFHSPGIEKRSDNTEYPEPEEMITQLSHRDIFLGFFKGKKNIIGKLRSGFELVVNGNVLYFNSEKGLQKIAVLSKSFQEKAASLRQKGYAPYKAKIRFIVAWKNIDDDIESAIILPDIYFRKA